ncbi:hypothetical protein [Streptomyces malaysiensis]|uniref:hypothetical protein n=1 Tax=Streptomyces malaysiensis TaxID=92644 RepID=UPI002B27EDD7|nr:hypothetical protein R8789_46235 [Streptomyces malaysiensis]
MGLDRWRRVLDTLEDAEKPGGPREGAALAAELDSPWHLALSAIVFDERNRAGEYVRSPDELLRLAADGELHEYLLDRYVAAAVRLPYRGASGDEPDLARRLRLHAGSTWEKLAVLARYLQDNNRAPRIVSGTRLSGTDMVPNELWPLAGVRRVRRTEAVLAALCLALWSTVLVLVSHVALAITLAGVMTVAMWYFAPALRRLENRSQPAGAACDGLAFGTMTGAMAVAFGAGTLRGTVAAAAGAVLSGAVSWAERTALARIRTVRTPLRRPWPTALLKGTAVGLTALTVVGVGVSAADGPAATGTAAVFSLGLGVVAGLEARAVAVLDTASLPRPGVRGLLTGLRWFAGLLVPLVTLVIPLTGGVGRWALFLCILSASAGLGVGIGAGFATSTEAMEQPPVFWLLAPGDSDHAWDRVDAGLRDLAHHPAGQRRLAPHRRHGVVHGSGGGHLRRGLDATPAYPRAPPTPRCVLRRSRVRSSRGRHRGTRGPRDPRLGTASPSGPVGRRCVRGCPGAAGIGP